MNKQSLKTNIESFLCFLNSDNSSTMNDELTDFFMKFDNESKEVIFDRGNLLLLSSGRQIKNLELESDNDRVVNLMAPELKKLILTRIKTGRNCHER